MSGTADARLLASTAFASLASLASLASVASADSRYASAPPATSTHESAIVGGTDVPAGKWPDTVAVLGETGLCSGTLIAPDVVLTAGHCAGITPRTVIANTVDYTASGGAKVSVKRTVAHPDWRTTYDVAVIQLAQPIHSVAPRRMGTACTFDMFVPDVTVWLVGFGATDKQGIASNTKLKEARAEVVDPSCSDGNGCNPAVAPGGEFVAGGTGSADSCFGDSGGPVYLDTLRGPVVVGAVSRGVPGATTPCGGGGIYVRTDAVVDWIEDTVGGEVAKDECVADAGSGGGGHGGFGLGVMGCSVGGGTGGGGGVVVVGLALAYVTRRRQRQR